MGSNTRCKDTVVYNVALEGGSSIKVNGIEVCTLGHGLTDNIVAHDFFGTARVLDNLKILFPSEYKQGRVDLSGCEFYRGVDGLVDGIFTCTFSQQNNTLGAKKKHIRLADSQRSLSSI